MNRQQIDDIKKRWGLDRPAAPDEVLPERDIPAGTICGSCGARDGLVRRPLGDDDPPTVFVYRCPACSMEWERTDG